MIWWQPIHTGSGSMLSAIIATHESERALVRTLAALVPGAVAGVIREVVVADGGSRDATEEVADVAGCRFLVSNDPLGARLKQAAAATRTPWMMFLRAGCVPDPAWVNAADRFMQMADALDGAGRAAVFRPPGIADLMRPGFGEIIAMLRVTLGGSPTPEQGLLIARRFYDALGGHSGGADAEEALLRRLGRRRIAMLPSGARAAD
jgi:glycosyltransferase involved in cell wall biosynthesis